MTDTTPGADREQRERVARAMWATFGRPRGWWDQDDAAIDREQYRLYADAALAAARPDYDTAAGNWAATSHLNHVHRPIHEDDPERPVHYDGRDDTATALERVRALADELDQELAEQGVLLDRVIRPGDRIRAALDPS